MDFVRNRLTRTRRVLAVALASMSALMLFATQALAQTSAQQGYSSPGASVQSATDPGTQAVHTSGSLPFTGLDLVAIVVVGVALLAVGLGIRRLAARAAAH